MDLAEVTTRYGEPLPIGTYDGVEPLRKEWIVKRGGVGNDVVERVQRWVGFSNITSLLKRTDVFVLTNEGITLARQINEHPIVNVLLTEVMEQDELVVDLSNAQISDASTMPHRQVVDGERFIFFTGNLLQFFRDRINEVSRLQAMSFPRNIVDVLAQFQLSLLIYHEEEHRLCSQIALPFSEDFRALAQYGLGIYAYKIGSAVRFSPDHRARYVRDLLPHVADRGVLIFEGGKVDILLDGHIVGEYGAGLNEAILDTIAIGKGSQFALDFLERRKRELTKLGNPGLTLAGLASSGKGSPEYRDQDVHQRQARRFLERIGLTNPDETFHVLTQLPPLLIHLAKGGTVDQIPTVFPFLVIKEIMEY